MPAPAAPVKPAEPETQTAAAAPPKEVAPTPRGEQPPAPAFGKAVYRGFAMAALDPPAGLNPAVYNAYLAAIRDKLAQERGRLRTFRYSGGGVRVHFTLDRQGRLQQAGVAASTGSRALENTVLNMLSYAAPFPAPPPEFSGAEISLRFDMILPTSAADWEEFLAGAKPS
jgi:protein TonB